MTDSYSTIKVRPGRGRRLAEGAPWAFADEIAMDRRTRNLAPGSLVRLADGPDILGLAAFNPESKISARLIDRDPDAKVGVDWFARRLDHALGMRQSNFDTPFYRLIHAEGDGLPGLIIDRFADALVIQPNAAWLDLRLADLCTAARDVTGAKTVVVNATSRTRKLEGLGEYTEIVSGALPGPIEVPMNGA
ncbi:MAG: RlmI/RlmK family 23S rRNA methyltransferase, partial [Pseudomonadota bacterium]